MRTDQTCHEGSEDGMNSNYTGEKRRRDSNQKRESDDRLAWPILKTAGLAQNPHEPGANAKEEEKRIANASKKNPKSSDTACGVHESNAKCEKNPTDDIVANTSRESDESNRSVKQF